MSKDYSGQNLCGRCFKEEDLTDANFAHSLIRGANFTNAILTNANFSYVKTGLPKQGASFLFLASLLLVALSGITSLIAGFLITVLPQGDYLNKLSDISSIIIGLSLLVLLVYTALKGFVEGLTAGILILIPSLIISTFFKDDNNISSIITAFFVGGAVDFLIASSYVGIAISTTTAMITLNSVPVAMAGTFIIAIVSAVALNKWELIHTSVAITVIVLVFGHYIAWRAILGDQKFSWIHNLAVTFASIGGTNFRGADLTNANFTKATLASTNFRGAILTRTCWKDTQKLDLARVGDSILAKPSVRNLLVSGNGYKKSYIGEKLKGANLTGVNLNDANLKEADLSEATLQGAHLEGANLTKSQAIGTDFTKASLTGACLEAWNIDSHTKLEQVDCRYVYLLEYPDDKGNRERRPHDPDKIFEAGDFAKLYQKIMNTVQILLRNGINSQAFTVAFRKLMEENPEITPNSIQAIEKKGDDVLLTLEVPEGTDKAKVQRNFESVYEARLESQKQAALLDAQIRHTQDIKEVTLTLASNLSNLLSNLTIIASGENTTMTDNKNQGINATGSFVNTGEMNNMTGSTINLGQISGSVSNAINQLPVSPQPDKLGIKELLTQLQAAIEAETNLTAEDKAEALEQVKALAEAGKNPQEGAMQKSAKTAMKILKGTVASLPIAATLYEACQKLLPAIAQLLSLV
jgi:uncharacterized protein YjbI with pentapeptide repeats